MQPRTHIAMHTSELCRCGRRLVMHRPDMRGAQRTCLQQCRLLLSDVALPGCRGHHPHGIVVGHLARRQPACSREQGRGLLQHGRGPPPPPPPQKGNDLQGVHGGSSHSPRCCGHAPAYRAQAPHLPAAPAHPVRCALQAGGASRALIPVWSALTISSPIPMRPAQHVRAPAPAPTHTHPHHHPLTSTPDPHPHSHLASLARRTPSSNSPRARARSMGHRAHSSSCAAHT